MAAKATASIWYEDHAVENRLMATHQVRGTWQTVPLNQIDEKLSSQNWGRVYATDGTFTDSSISASLVEQYADAMLAKDRFPGIVGYRPSGNTKIVILSGNHRFRAAKKCGFDSILMYRLPDSLAKSQAAAIAIELNSINGQSVPLESRVLQAFHLIQLGFSRNEACRLTKITPAYYARTHRRNELIHQLQAMKIYSADKFPAAVLDELSNAAWKCSNAVYDAVLDACSKTTFTPTDLKELKREVHACRSESEMLDCVNAKQKVAKMVAKPVSYRSDPRKKALQCIQRFESLLLQYDSIEEMGVTPEEAEEIACRFIQMEQRLHTLSSR